MIKLFNWIAKARRRPITQLESILKKKVSEFVKVYKRRPSERELLKFIENVDRNLFNEVDSVVRSAMRKQYDKVQTMTARELNIPSQITNQDLTALTVLQNQRVLTDSISGLRQKTVEGLKTIFEEAYRSPDGINTKRLQDNIRDLTEMADYRVERIARAEMSKVSTASRRMSYLKADPSDSFLYVARGPVDSRTSDMSLELQRRTKDGVSWQEYVNISMDIASRLNPKWKVDPMAPLMQPNQRTQPFRKVV